MDVLEPSTESFFEVIMEMPQCTFRCAVHTRRSEQAQLEEEQGKRQGRILADPCSLPFLQANSTPR